MTQYEHGMLDGIMSHSSLTDSERIVEHVRLMLREARLTILKELSHEFSPQGYTHLFLLAESHCSIHTWPEHGRISIDLFSCKGEVEAHLHSLARRLCIGNPVIRVVKR